MQEAIEINKNVEINYNQAVQKICQVCDSLTSSSHNNFALVLTIFILACFVGYFVVWRVTPALHTPLMAVTNAISGVILVGAIISLGKFDGGFSTISIMSFLAIIIASVNIFGGFFVTYRMLEMFKK